MNEKQNVCPCPLCPERRTNSCTIFKQRHCPAWIDWYEGNEETEIKKQG